MWGKTDINTKHRIEVVLFTLSILAVFSAVFLSAYFWGGYGALQIEGTDIRVHRFDTAQKGYKNAFFMFLSPSDIIQAQNVLAGDNTQNQSDLILNLDQYDKAVTDFSRISATGTNSWFALNLLEDVGQLKISVDTTVKEINGYLTKASILEKDQPTTALAAYKKAYTIAAGDEVIGADQPLLSSIQRKISWLEQSATPVSDYVLVAQKGDTPHPIKVPILMYHYIRVNPIPSDILGFGLSVTPTDFDSQMHYLATNGYTSITMTDLLTALETGATLPSKPIVITFDDGYTDYYTNAFPVLKKYGLRSETYVIAGFVGRQNYMTWDMLKQLLASGLVTVGSHTIDHPDLSKLPLNALDSELVDSKHMLESTLGITVTDFCYPYGKYSPLVISEVEKAGYKDATTTMFGSIQTPGNYYTMSRVRVNGGESLSSFIVTLQY